MAEKTFKIGLSNTDKQNMAQDVYERLLALTFPEYDTSETYAVGDFVVYNDQLYKCIGATSGAWDSTKWQLATLNDLLTDIESAVAFVNDKANVDGNYPTMTVGLAGNLDTKIVDNDVNAYNFRPTGGLDTESGNNCKEKAIVGGSLGFNQLVQNGNFASDSAWAVARGTKSVSNNICTLIATEKNGLIQTGVNFVSGHKYFKTTKIKLTTATNLIYSQCWDSGALVGYVQTKPTTDWQVLENVFMANNTGAGNVAISDQRESDWDAIQVSNVMCIDLTAMFGSTIADYIYSLETATAGAGVAWFKRYFNKPYYPYTPIGGFTNVITHGKKAVGFNQWDEEWEVGAIDNGNNSVNNNRIRSKNYISCFPNTTYYFKTPASPYYLIIFFYDKNKNYISNVGRANTTQTTPVNAYYMRFYVTGGDITTYNNDICINFHYDGERDGEYEPYREEIYENDPVELIGIPHIDAQGNLYYEGNVYRPDGTVENNYGIVDLGTLDWTYNGDETYPRFVSSDLSAVIKRVNVNQTANAISTLYITTPVQTITNSGPNMSIGISNNGIISIRNTFYVDEVTFKSAMSGVYFIYELAAPTQSSASPYPETQWVDNWGTEERLPPLNDTRPCEIPVGHDTDYPLDLKSKLEIMANSPANDGDYVLHSESGVNTYVALGSWLSTNGYVKLTDISGYDAAATQVLKNVEGTLTWVTEE